MRSYLDFEKPVAELEAKVEELRAMGESDDAVAIGEEIGRLEVKAAAALKELYAELTPWQKTQVARHPAAAALPRLHRRPDHRFHAARRRPQIRRGRGHRRRLRPLPRREPSACIGHEKGSDTESRLKHNFGMAHAGGLSQGGAADGDGRPLRYSGDHAGRHRRRLSRHRRRGARPGRGHRALDRGVPQSRRAQCRGDPRRRRLGRRHRASPPPTAC